MRNPLSMFNLVFRNITPQLVLCHDPRATGKLSNNNHLVLLFSGLCLFFSAFLSQHAFAILNNVKPEHRDLTVKRIKASHFLHQATFGPRFGEINALALRMKEIGERRALHEWISNQFAIPFSKNGGTSFEQRARNLLNADGYAVDALGEDGPGYAIQNYKHHAWWDKAIRDNDQLRQRVAWALIQIFVISERGMMLNTRNNGHWLGILDYYDMLASNAFGSYRNLLRDVSLHPAMGLYLSHLKNAKADPAKGTFPDENYAREILQLFSIGVYRLRQNGQPLLDRDGNPIETYTNNTIRNFSRVFTGLGYAPSAGRDDFRRNPRNMFAPMKMYDAYHDSDAKTLLRGQRLPAGQSGMRDFNQAINNIVAHPNVPPFISRLLIQRFTSSNPSGAYVRAVADKFTDDGRGNRGNMRAVIRKILMHPEARNALTIQQTRKANGRYQFEVSGRYNRRGKVREPLLALTAMYRALRAQAGNDDGRFRPRSPLSTTNQGSFQSPSVFNFYLPDYQPGGTLQNQNLVAPELQIYTPVMLNRLANFIRSRIINRNLGLGDGGTLNTATEESQAHAARYMLERLDLMLAYGTLSRGALDDIHAAITSTENLDHRTELALISVLNSPDFMVMQ